MIILRGAQKSRHQRKLFPAKLAHTGGIGEKKKKGKREKLILVGEKKSKME